MGFNSKYNRDGFDAKIGANLNPAINGANLLLAPPRDLINHTQMINVGGIYYYTLNFNDLSSIRNKTVTISIEVEIVNVTSLRTDSSTLPTRAGFEPIIIFSDGTTESLSCWTDDLSIGDTFIGRIQQTYKIKDIAIQNVLQEAMYIQIGGASTMKIGKPKIEMSEIATSFVPNKDDLVNAFAFYKADLAGDINGSLTSLETATN